MYAAFLERTRRSIGALKQHLATSEALRLAIHDRKLACTGTPPCSSAAFLSMDTAPDRLEWRVIDHCAAITRIYAVYEQFAHEMLREHLSLMQNHIAFSKLPEELRKAYCKGMSLILGKIGGPRYGNINLSNLIEQYSLALSDKNYVLEPLALLTHEQNLRLPELIRLFDGCGISDVGPWINGHRAVRNFFNTEGRLGASAEHEMKELIKYRNDAAHGSINVDDVLGLDYLYEFCDFIIAICEAVSEITHLTGLKRLIGAGVAEERGSVDACVKNDLVLIGVMTGSFAVGDLIYLYGSDYCLAREVMSLQIQNVDHPEVLLAEPTELGLAINEPGRKNARIIALQPQKSFGDARPPPSSSTESEVGS